ncbi:anti-sigma factor antagonist BldG [soil metagenome]
MDFKVEGNNERLVVRVSGEVTAASSAELRQAVQELSARKPQAIVLDLTDMPFIDTSGLGVLVGLRSHLKRQGTALSVENPQARVLQVFRLTQLSRIFGMDA